MKNFSLAVIFDLDDTLFHEWRFVASGASFVAEWLENIFGDDFSAEKCAMIKAVLRGRNHFDILEEMLESRGLSEHIDMSALVAAYRSHRPEIKPARGCVEVLGLLEEKGVALGIITDGRSSTQRNKIEALGIRDMFDSRLVMISEETGAEKATGLPFRLVGELLPDCSHFVYVGDNPAKDIEAPHSLGWKTVLIEDRGYNIRRQQLSGSMAQPDIILRSLSFLPAALSEAALL